LIYDNKLQPLKYILQQYTPQNRKTNHLI